MWTKLRVKYIWDYVPLPRTLELVWDRLTISKLAIVYLVFSSTHCIIQISLQSWAYQTNANSATLMHNLALEGNATDDRIPVFIDAKMYLCEDVPLRNIEGVCVMIWGDDGVDASIQGQSPATEVRSSLGGATVTPSASTVVPVSATASTSVVSPATATPVDDVASEFDDDSDGEGDGSDSDSNDEDSDSDDEDDLVLASTAMKKRWHPFDTEVIQVDGKNAVNITGSSIPGENTLSRECLWALNWPVAKLENTKREDVVFIAFQIWVLGMSLAALLNESIPHIFASLLTHVLATAWSGFQINHTAVFKRQFQKLITSSDGACKVNLLPNYWEGRANAEYATLALNIVALFGSGFLTWKLVKLFGWQTFKRIGASLKINHIYRLVLVLSILIQISVFFIAATAGLWLDSLLNGVAAEFAWYTPLYKASIIAVILLLIPWLMTGWFAIRRELRISMLIFLFMSILYLIGWSMMFLSDTFRWLFKDWVFFSIMATFSVVLTVSAFGLGVACRVNFGKGLKQYLDTQEALPGDGVFVRVTEASDAEKIDFPSSHAAIPTYSAAFGSEAPLPAQMLPVSFGPHMGPRFFNSSAPPFDAGHGVARASMPRTLSRSPSGTSITWSDGSYGPGMFRQASTTSKSSEHYRSSSSDSGHSMSSERSYRPMKERSWSIE